jgi:hypothetical protein
MATLSKSISLKYTVPAGSPVTVTGVTGIPALGTAPASHDVTELLDTAHKYIKGLADSGGSLDFSCNFSSTLVTLINTAVAGGPATVWTVTFPTTPPVVATFTGDANPLFTDAVEVDAPITATLSIIPTSAITFAA